MKAIRRFAIFLIMPYMVVFLMPSLLFVVTLQANLRDMKKNIENTYFVAIENTIISLEQQLNELRNESLSLSMQVANMQKAKHILSYELNASQIYRQLSIKKMSHPLLDTIYIILPHDNIVETPYITGSPFDVFYGDHFSMDQMSREDFKQYISDNKFDRAFFDNVKINRAGYDSINTLLLHSIQGQSGGVVLSVINTESIKQMLKKLVPQSGFGSIIYGKASSNIQIHSNTNNIEDEELSQLYGLLENSSRHLSVADGVMTFYAKSNSGNTIGYIAVPENLVLSDITSFTRTLSYQAVAIIVFVAAVLVWFLYRNILPIKSIVKAFSPSESELYHAKGNVYEYIRLSASDIIKQNLLLKDDHEKKKLILRERFFRKLLKNEFLQESDILLEQSKLDINLDYKHYVVMLYQKKNPSSLKYKELKVYTNHTKEAIRKFFSSGALFFDYEIDCVAILIGSNLAPEEFAEYIEQNIQALYSADSAQVCCGSIVASILDASLSYREAQFVKNNITSEHDGCIWYGDVYGSALLKNYWITPFLEDKLINNIASGNTYMVEEIFASIFEGGMQKDCTVIEEKCSAYNLYRLACQALSFKRNGAGQDSISELNALFEYVIMDKGNFALLYEKVKELCLNITCENKKGRKSDNEKLYKTIIEYIDENYTSSQICVASIAEHCCISAKYLSLFFKEMSNQNVSVYIEKLRIKKACKLLRESEDSIDNIAAAVGYTSAHTFRTAFKRCMSVTPSDYRI